MRRFPGGRPGPLDPHWVPEVQVDKVRAAAAAAGVGGAVNWAQQSCSAGLGQPGTRSYFLAPARCGRILGQLSNSMLLCVLGLGRWLPPLVSDCGGREEQQVSKIPTFLCQFPPGAKKGRLNFLSSTQGFPGERGQSQTLMDWQALGAHIFGGKKHFPRLGRVPDLPAFH